MLQVQFFLRGTQSINPKKMTSIYCQLAIEGMRRDIPFSTGIKIPSAYWDRERASDDYPLADNVNRHLLNIRKAFQDIFDMHSMLYPSQEITYAYLRNNYLGEGLIKPPGDCPTLKAAVLRLIDHKRDVEKLQGNTLKTYTTRKKALFMYLEKSRQQEIKISQVRHSFVEGFKTFLSMQYDQDGQPMYCKNSINKYLSLISSTIDFAVKQEWIQFKTLGKMNLAYEKPKPPKYLTAPLRQAIINCKHPSVEKVRDVAVFLMHTGFSYIDYQTLRNEHLIGNCFRKARNKTKIFSMPILLPETKKVIQKYGSIDRLPRPDMADINKELKFLGDLVGINRHTVGFDLSTSVFRDTFISMMENEYMIDERTLMRMSGHTNRRQLDTYSNISPERMIYELRERNKNFKIEI